jgi:hypothetical protein
MTNMAVLLPRMRHHLAVADADVPLSNALNAVWAKIRELHQDVPEATVIVTRGRESTCSAAAWDVPQRVIEISPATLERGRGQEVEDIVALLLHHAVHGAVGPPGTASEGRYHSVDFRDKAREFGFIVPEAPSGGTGWNDTAMPDATARVYSTEITALKRALRHWEPPPPVRTARPDVIAWCSCPKPRRLRMANSVWEAGPVVCGVCGQEFRREN